MESMNKYSKILTIRIVSFSVIIYTYFCFYSVSYGCLIPQGFSEVSSAPGVTLYANHDNKTYVQVVDLSKGAKVDFIINKKTSDGEGDGAYGGDNPKFELNYLNTIWDTHRSKNYFSMLNGATFVYSPINGGTIVNPWDFYQCEGCTTELAFPLIANSVLITGGDKKGEWLRMLEIWDDKADVRAMEMDQTDAPNVLVGRYADLDPQYDDDGSDGITMVGVCGQHKEIVVILVSDRSTISNAVQTLINFGVTESGNYAEYSKVIMFDGDDSSQLMGKNRNGEVRHFVNANKRVMPQAIGIQPGDGFEGYLSLENQYEFIECMDMCIRCDLNHIVCDKDKCVSNEFVERIIKGSFSQAMKDRIINYLIMLYGRDKVEGALIPCQNCVIEIGNEYFTTYEYLEYLEDYVPITASGDLEALFKYVKVSDAGKDMWEDSVTLDPGEKYDIKIKFYTYTGTAEIEGDVKFYLSDDKHFDTDEDEYLGKDTFTLRTGEEEKEYLRGEHAPDEEGNYYIFCHVRWDDNRSFYTEEYAKIKVRIPNYVPEGYLDLASCNTISGWARDANTTNPISVHIYADGPAGTGTLVGTTVANILRNDLSYSDKNHGFSFRTPTSLKDNQPHSIYAYAIDSEGGHNPLLTNSPQSMDCVPIEAILSVVNNILLTDTSHLNLSCKDMNGDSQISIADAILVFNVLCGMDITNPNCSQKIEIQDAIIILQQIANLR